MDRRPRRDASNAMTSPSSLELTKSAFLARPGFSSLVLHGLSLVIRLGFMLVVLRQSGAAVLGVFGLLLTIEVIVVYLCGLEFHTFTTRRYARRPSLVMLRLCVVNHSQVLLICIPFGALISAAIAVGFKLELSVLQLGLLATLVAASMLANEAGRFTVLTNKPLHSVLLTFIRTTSWQPFVLPFLGSDAELTALLSLWSAGSLLSAGCALWFMRVALGSRVRPRKRYILRGLSLSRTSYLTTSASLLLGSIDRLILQLVLGPSAVGTFTFFQTLANTLPALVQSAVLNVWLSQLLIAFGQKTTARMSLLSKLVRRCFLVGALLSLAICIVSFPLVWFISNRDYFSWLWILYVLLVGQILLISSQPLHLAIFAAHRDYELMWLSIGSLVLGLATSALLTISFGLVGATAASLIAASVLWAARRLLLRYLAEHGIL